MAYQVNFGTGPLNVAVSGGVSFTPPNTATITPVLQGVTNANINATNTNVPRSSVTTLAQVAQNYQQQVVAGQNRINQYSKGTNIKR